MSFDCNWERPSWRLCFPDVVGVGVQRIKISVKYHMWEAVVLYAATGATRNCLWCPKVVYIPLSHTYLT